jgi:hypothetical protein
MHSLSNYQYTLQLQTIFNISGSGSGFSFKVVLDGNQLDFGYEDASEYKRLAGNQR